MKKLLPQFAPIALAALLIVSSHVYAEEPNQRGEITWSRGESGDQSILRAELAERSKKYSSDAPEFAEFQAKIAAIEKNQPWLLSFDFPGGSLGKFLALISRANVVSFSVINSDPTDLAVELPPFVLRNAEVVTVIKVLGNLLEPRGYSLRDVGGAPNSVVCVIARHPGAAPANNPPTMFESFSLKPYLAEQSVDEIVATIHEGWELDPAHDKTALRLKFHPATSILLVSGPPEAMNVAGRIISQLIRPAPKPAPFPETKPESKE